MIVASLCRLLRVVSAFYQRIAILLLLVLITIAESGSAQAQVARFAGVVTMLGRGYGQPYGVAVDGSGNVYVADGSQVYKLQASCINGPDPASCVAVQLGYQFSNPEAVAVDSYGNVYIADYSGKAVSELSASCINGSSPASCTSIPLSSGFLSPRGVVVDRSGNVYVADSDGGKVYEIFDTCIRGNPSPSNCAAAPLGYGFSRPQGVTVDNSGNVFIADGGASPNVYELQASCIDGANPVACSPIQLSSGFVNPTGLALDSTGTLYVADTASTVGKEIQGGCINGPSPSTCPYFAGGGGFGGLRDLAIDSSGNVYSADAVETAIRKCSFLRGVDFGSLPVDQTSSITLTFAFDAAGIIGPPQALTKGATGMYFTVSAAQPAGACAAGHYYNVNDICTVDVTFTPGYTGSRNGAVILTNTSGRTIVTAFIFGVGTGPQVVFNRPLSPSTPYGGGFNMVLSVAVDGNSNIFVADNSANQIVEIPSNCYSSGCVAQRGSGFNGPSGVAVGGAGNVYVADTSNNAVKMIPVDCIAGANNATCVNTLGGGFTSPYDVAVDGTGNVYATAMIGGTGVVVEIPRNCIETSNNADCTKTLGGGFIAPEGITVDSYGDVFVTDRSNNSVEEIPLNCINGANDATCVKMLGGGFSYPTALVTDAAGNVYVADSSNNSSAPNGSVKEIPVGCINGANNAGCVLTLSNEFARPNGITIDRWGNLYVADETATTVNEIIRTATPGLIFNNTQVGSTSPSLNMPYVTMQNIGTSPLTFPPLTAGTNLNPYITTDNYTWNSSSTCPQVRNMAGTLASGDICTVAIDFTPISSGAHSNSVIVTDDSLYVTQPYATQTIPLRGTAVAADTVTVVTSSVNPSTYGQDVTLQATVKTSDGTLVSAGTVQFYIDGTYVGLPITVVDGVVAYGPVNTLVVGNHPVTAVYTADALGRYIGSTAPAITQMVNRAVLTVTADNQSRMYGVANSGLTYTITGFVNSETSSVVSGTPALSTTAVTLSPVGDYPITLALGTLNAANYSFTTTDGTLTVTQAMGAAASTTLTLSPSTVMYGDPSVLTATVAPPGATGTVTFTATQTSPSGGGSPITLGTSNLDSNEQAVWPEDTLSAGTYNIVATYNGDTNLAANSSQAQVLTVTQRTGPDGGPALTVTVNDATRTTTEINPPFNYTVAGALVNDDTYATAITGTPFYSTRAGGTAGQYAISVTGLVSRNYQLVFVDGALTVVPEPETTTTLTISPSKPEYNDPVTLTATVNAPAATGTVSFYDGTVYIGDGTVSDGVATLVTSSLSAGTHTITAIYNGDASYPSSESAPGYLTVAKRTGSGPGNAALTITVLDASRVYRAANPQFVYVVSGTLVNNDTYAAAVTGVPVYSTTATLTSPVGSSYMIQLVDSSGNACTSSSKSCSLVSDNYVLAFVSGTLEILPNPTATNLASSATEVQYGDSLTLTATVSKSGATGQVAFSNGSDVLGMATVSGGVATLTTSSLPLGSYTITATYLGDNNYGGSTSAPVTVMADKRHGPAGPDDPALTVTTDNATRQYGQDNPSFTYAVSGTLVNGDTYATAVTGVPIFSTTATIISPIGKYPISVNNLNSANYVLGFVNGTLTVAKGTPVPTLSISPNLPQPNQSSTITATLPAGTGGTVTFTNNGTPISECTGVSVINGTANCVTTLPVGTDTISGTYNGDDNNNTALLPTQTVTVSTSNPAADFAIVATQTTQKSSPGATESYPVHLSSVNGAYSCPVTLSAESSPSLPAGSTLSFAQNPVTPGSNGADTTLQVNLASQTSAVKPDANRLGTKTSLLLAAMLLPLVTCRHRRNLSKLLIVLMLGLIGTAAISGCNGFGPGGYYSETTSNQTYTITITGTGSCAGGVSSIHSTTVTLTVGE